MSLCGCECLFVSVCASSMYKNYSFVGEVLLIIIKILSIKHNFILLNY